MVGLGVERLAPAGGGCGPDPASGGRNGRASVASVRGRAGRRDRCVVALPRPGRDPGVVMVGTAAVARGGHQAGPSSMPSPRSARQPPSRLAAARRRRGPGAPGWWRRRHADRVAPASDVDRDLGDGGPGGGRHRHPIRSPGGRADACRRRWRGAPGGRARAEGGKGWYGRLPPAHGGRKVDDVPPDACRDVKGAELCDRGRNCFQLGRSDSPSRHTTNPSASR